MCFDPDLCTTGQRLVGGVDHGAWAVNRDPVALGIPLAGFDGQHGQVCAFGVGADMVLVNMYARDHLLASIVLIG